MSSVLACAVVCRVFVLYLMCSVSNYWIIVMVAVHWSEECGSQPIHLRRLFLSALLPWCPHYQIPFLFSQLLSLLLNVVICWLEEGTWIQYIICIDITMFRCIHARTPVHHFIHTHAHTFHPAASDAKQALHLHFSVCRAECLYCSHNQSTPQ